MDANLIFQRTHTGREEIHEKRHGLTQSERLVLIMVDGVTTYDDVRKKLPVLREERYARAFITLIQKELIVEVFMPVADQTPDAVERSVIDRFLQQDPLDPVTIIIHDVEEELGDASTRNDASTADSPQFSATHEAAFHSTSSSPPSESRSKMVPHSNMDDHHIALADSLTRVLQEQRMQGKRQSSQSSRANVRSFVESQRKDESVPRPAQWPYWSIGIGIAFIAGFVAARLPI